VTVAQNVSFPSNGGTTDGYLALPESGSGPRGIEAAGGEVTPHDYPGSKHALFNDGRPEVYDAADAWARTVAALNARLGLWSRGRGQA
jgi:carboxymethylenebutenolidase